VAEQPSWPIMWPDLWWSHTSNSAGAYGKIADLV